MALAQAIDSKAAAAYRRGDLLEKRRLAAVGPIARSSLSKVEFTARYRELKIALSGLTSTAARADTRRLA